MRSISATWRSTPWDRGDASADSRISPENPSSIRDHAHQVPDDGRATATDVVDPVRQAWLGREEVHGRGDVPEVDVVADGIERAELDSRRAVDHGIPKQSRGPSRQRRRGHPGTDRVEDAGNDRVEARLGSLAHQSGGCRFRDGVGRGRREGRLLIGQPVRHLGILGGRSEMDQAGTGRGGAHGLENRGDRFHVRPPQLVRRARRAAGAVHDGVGREAFEQPSQLIDGRCREPQHLGVRHRRRRAWQRPPWLHRCVRLPRTPLGR